MIRLLVLFKLIIEFVAHRPKTASYFPDEEEYSRRVVFSTSKTRIYSFHLPAYPSGSFNPASAKPFSYICVVKSTFGHINQKVHPV
jgi:hypothetical protein